MNPEEFAVLAEELNQHMRQATIDFFAERGLGFNVEAYRRQTTIQPELFITELIYFGADVFPVPPGESDQE